ncbi:MAG: helix-turn-helix transcriptional regulator [Deltaproteobacteria bacterium]|nr:helix-turn-helix transcriptional regulator [Deltaproteobacteria bacterium]
MRGVSSSVCFRRRGINTKCRGIGFCTRRKRRIHRPNLSRVESGRHRPSLETLEKIAAALKVPIVDLVLRK